MHIFFLSPEWGDPIQLFERYSVVGVFHWQKSLELYITGGLVISYKLSYNLVITPLTQFRILGIAIDFFKILRLRLKFHHWTAKTSFIFQIRYIKKFLLFISYLSSSG